LKKKRVALLVYSASGREERIFIIVACWGEESSKTDIHGLDETKPSRGKCAPSIERKEKRKRGKKAK